MSESAEHGPEGDRIVPLRLQKFLARAGVASRRGSEDLMTAGRVTVNGVVVTELGSRVDPLVDCVEVDGIEVRLGTESTYLILNKPTGYLTTMSDPQGRPTVAELVPRDPAGLFPVGRLDKDTTGLLLFTTDGDLAHRLLHPRFHVQKRYIARVQGFPVDHALKSLREGIVLEDGPTKPAGVTILDRAESHTDIEVTISEGRKRQVRRMFLAIGHPVIALHRVSFGPLELRGLAEGETRVLESTEIERLRAVARG